MQNSEDTLWCLVCNVFLINRNEADKHFCSTYHQERVDYLLYMKRNHSRSSDKAAASDERRPKIHEVYRTPHDYFQGERNMTTSEQHERWSQKNDFPGPTSVNNGGEGTSSKKKRPRHRPNRNNSNESQRETSKPGFDDKRLSKFDQSSKSTRRGDPDFDRQSDRSSSRNKTDFDRQSDRSSSRNKTDFDRQSNRSSVRDDPEFDRQSVISDNSVLSRPSVWGRDTHNINPGINTSDYWGSSCMENRPRGDSVSSASWSVRDRNQGERYKEDRNMGVGNINMRDRDQRGRNEANRNTGYDDAANRYNSDGRRGYKNAEERNVGNINQREGTQRDRSVGDRNTGYDNTVNKSSVDGSRDYKNREEVERWNRGGSEWYGSGGRGYDGTRGGGEGSRNHGSQSVQQGQQAMQPGQQAMQPMPSPVQQVVPQTQHDMQPVHQLQPVLQLQPVPQLQQAAMQPDPQLQFVQQQLQSVQQNIQLVQQQVQHIVQQGVQHMQPHVVLLKQPVQQIQQPVQLLQQPVQLLQQPVQQMQQPVQQMQQPVQLLQQPVQPMQQPVQLLQQPVQQPMQLLQQPMQVLQQPVQQGVQQPVQLLQQPVQQNMQPIQHGGQQAVQQPMQILRRPQPQGSPVKTVVQMFREAKHTKRNDDSRKTQPGGTPKSPSKNSANQSPTKDQEAARRRTKNFLGNTYFGRDRPHMDVPENCDSIYVRNEEAYEMAEEDLKKVFSMFGEVVSITIPSKKKQQKSRRPLSMIVTFKNRYSVKEAVKKTLFMGGKFTPVNPVYKKLEKPVNPKMEKANGPVDIYDIRDICEPGLPFEAAILRFKAMMQTDDDQLEAQQRLVCRDLEATFGHILPGVKAKLFGSSQIGLRLKDSDTDIFMDCPSGQPQRNFVQKYGYLMFDNKCFEKVVKIATARVPIMTFNHVETGLLCDVTFLNKLGLKNSEMLRFLLSLDPRIRDLALIVKYWAKVHELASLGNYSNYAITFMVIFYLQQLPEPLVPPIYLLQKLADKKEVCENWECSFCSDVNKLPKITNKSSTKELLLGFFDYWACFDFERILACTLLGRTFQKSEFQDYENLPDELEGYKRHAREVHAQLEADKLLETAVDKEQKLTYSEKRSKLSLFEKIHALNYDLPVCIQDAFDLSYNITRMIKEPLLKRFQWLCEYARDEVLSKIEDGKALLDLFLPPKNKPPEIVTHEFTSQKDLFMDNYTILGVNFKEERYKEVWFIVARLTLVFVLTHVYCLEFEMDDSNETKAIMSSERMELIDKVYRTVCMKMKGASAVLHNRAHSRKRLLMTNDAFINECVVTREIIMFLRNKEREKGDFSEKLLGNFTMKIRFFCFPEEPRPRLMVQFINCKSPHFNTVSNVLNTVLLSGFQRNIERCIKENNLPVKEYLKDGGGDWYDFANYFEDFVRDCTEKGRGLCEDPRYAMVFQKTEAIQNDKKDSQKEEEST